MISDTYESKARHLRALYRAGGGELGYPAVRAEFDRLFPAGGARLDLILLDAWTEGRALAGQTYDYGRQAWIGRDGSPADEAGR